MQPNEIELKARNSIRLVRMSTDGGVLHTTRHEYVSVSVSVYVYLYLYL